jgi:hypothetical protein
MHLLQIANKNQFAIKLILENFFEAQITNHTTKAKFYVGSLRNEKQGRDKSTSTLQ